MPTPAESGFRHGRPTMPKLRVGMPPTILATMLQMAKVLPSTQLLLFVIVAPVLPVLY